MVSALQALPEEEGEEATELASPVASSGSHAEATPVVQLQAEEVEEVEQLQVEEAEEVEQLQVEEVEGRASPSAAAMAHVHAMVRRLRQLAAAGAAAEAAQHTGGGGGGDVAARVELQRQLEHSQVCAVEYLNSLIWLFPTLSHPPY
jgi:hypothetical protein